MTTGEPAELDADTELERVGARQHRGQASARWSVGPALNGGYGLVLGLRAIAAEVSAPDPLSVTGHFLGALMPGPVEVAVEVAKEGRATTTASAAVRQGGRERLRVLALLGTLPTDPAPVLVAGAPPDLPPVEACVGPTASQAELADLPIGDRFDHRFDPAHLERWVGGPHTRADVAAWSRFADGRSNNLLGLACLVDSFLPALGLVGVKGWVPTLELTVHLRAHPAPGWLRCAISSRCAQGGLVDEDCEVWDGDGRLVAASRQLSRLP